NVPVADFHDVITGTNGYAAGVGYDLVTGLGTPLADLLIPDLVAYNGAISSERTVTVTADTVGSGGSGGNLGGPMNAVFRVFNAELVATPGQQSGAGQRLAAAGLAVVEAPTAASAVLALAP